MKSEGAGGLLLLALPFSKATDLARTEEAQQVSECSFLRRLKPVIVGRDATDIALPNPIVLTTSKLRACGVRKNRSGIKKHVLRIRRCMKQIATNLRSTDGCTTIRV